MADAYADAYGMPHARVVLGGLSPDDPADMRAQNRDFGRPADSSNQPTILIRLDASSLKTPDLALLQKIPHEMDHFYQGELASAAQGSNADWRLDPADPRYEQAMIFAANGTTANYVSPQHWAPLDATPDEVKAAVAADKAYRYQPSEARSFWVEDKFKDIYYKARKRISSEQ
ncbi:MAG TPA: hypothetical protein VEU47_19825 [Candidatus Cybelea sp.]|nr:hypothetical protein [Candidatus Cybelea sp.]